MTSRISISDAVETLAAGGLPVRFTAYDGSSAGPPDTPIGLRLANERGLSYLLTAPGDLGMSRAYVAGDLIIEGVHPGNPYDGLVLLQDKLKFRLPGPGEAVGLLRGLGLSHLRPPEPPPPRSGCLAGAAPSRGCGTR